MVSEGYDHLVAIVIVSMIFVGTVVALPAINYSNLQIMDQQQLRNTALSVFNSMLLDVGSPSNWASDSTTVERFGLAYADPFSKYVLDVQKVQRINETNPGSIKYDAIRTLLNIEEEYGFQFVLSRPFEVDCSLNIEGNAVPISVEVTRTEDGTPIPNARVSLTCEAYVVRRNDEIDPIYPVDPIAVTIYTDSSGMCEARPEFVLEDPTDIIDYAVAYLQIDVAGMLTTVIARNNDPFEGLVSVFSSGDEISLSIPEELLPASAGANTFLLEIDGYVNGEVIPLLEFDKGPKLHFNEGTGRWEILPVYIPNLRALNPTALLIWVKITLKEPWGGFKTGSHVILLTGSLDFGSTKNVFSAGHNPVDESPIVTMRRLVVISDMTYVATLTFWRE